MIQRKAEEATFTVVNEPNDNAAMDNLLSLLEGVFALFPVTGAKLVGLQRVEHP